jgi:hypothetical protein
MGMADDLRLMQALGAFQLPPEPPMGYQPMQAPAQPQPALPNAMQQLLQPPQARPLFEAPGFEGNRRDLRYWRPMPYFGGSRQF